jgi:hypothetical protein
MKGKIMSEEKKERTLEEVKNEFNQLCFRAGSLQYEIAVKNKDLEMLNESLRNLNFEASKIQAKAILAQQAEKKENSNES